MKRIVLAYCLAALATAAQAQVAEHRHAQSTGNEGRAESALRWFAAHAGTLSSATRPAPVAHAARRHVVIVAAASDETPAAAPTRTLATPAVLPSTSPPPGHGRISSCSEGARIVSAYYADGRRTASGERFDPNGMTAAHRTLPFGTHLKVINPRNGKVVMVRVNDRGPFVRGVTLDLSRGAAQAIGLQGTGAVCMAEM
jgi:rare lipoprotein A